LQIHEEDINRSLLLKAFDSTSERFDGLVVRWRIIWGALPERVGAYLPDDEARFLSDNVFFDTVVAPLRRGYRG
jgi:hypothetical protein